MLNRASNSSLTLARFNHFFFCAFSVIPSFLSPPLLSCSPGGWSYRFSRFAVKLCRSAKTKTANSKQKTTQTKQNQFQFQTKRFVQITQRFPLLVFTCYVRVASSAQDGRKTDLQYRVSEVFFANCPFRLSKKRFKEITRARDLFSARNIRICSVSL